jgi:alkylation response protein AidB-like acyl-CoA dehydrogenase
MSEIAPAEPRPTSVLDNARALLPEIKARAEEIEQARAVPRDLAEQLRGAGVFRRYVPRTHGGDELWPDEGLTVIEELARADASVAWVAAVGSEGPSFYAYLPPETYDKIFAAGPDVIHSGVINPASVPFGPPDNTATAIRRARLSRAASVAASVVDGAYGLSGTTGLFASCPLQRRLRDVRAVTQHYMLSARSAFGPVGTALLSEESAG